MTIPHSITRLRPDPPHGRPSFPSAPAKRVLTICIIHMCNTCVYTYIHIYIYITKTTNTYIHLSLSLYTYVYLYIYIYIYRYIHMYALFTGLSRVRARRGASLASEAAAQRMINQTKHNIYY